MELITLSYCVFGSRKILTLLDNLIYYSDKFLLNSLKSVRENNFMAFSYWQFQWDKIIFKTCLCIILSLNNLNWSWIFWVFVSFDKLYISLNRLFNKLSNLISHESRCWLKKCLCLIFIKIFKFISKYFHCTFIPIWAKESFYFTHLCILIT